ncbi:conserved Plasmodium protein, unknown function [Plasmodium ovale wallikeri]|uniref:Uncharacterized protein n=1 Tax=Plasmodium ovale wallikeri TaxID=864142 RepID=A0A1A8YKP7_PLAOA|nr:conserved Plasmodium protein, unknown function [Plasmodium ovale wallikeri]
MMTSPYPFKNILDIGSIRTYKQDYYANNLEKNQNYFNNVKKLYNFYTQDYGSSDEETNHGFHYTSNTNLNIRGYTNNRSNGTRKYFSEYVRKRIAINRTLLQKTSEENQLHANIVVNDILHKILSNFKGKNVQSEGVHAIGGDDPSCNYDAVTFLYDTSYYFLYTL